MCLMQLGRMGGGSLENMPEERQYTEVERQRFLLEIQGVGQSEGLPSRLLDEVALYTRRRSQGYLAHLALDESRFGAHLASYVRLGLISLLMYLTFVE